jgi:hypothetical protein
MSERLRQNGTRKDVRLDSLDGLELDSNVEVERNVDTESLTTLVEGTEDGLETSLNLDLG